MSIWTDPFPKSSPPLWGPVPVERPFVGEDSGPVKTLRDEFAMAALQGLIAMDTDVTVKRMRDAGKEPITVQCAAAYKFADAMMKAREGR